MSYRRLIVALVTMSASSVLGSSRIFDNNAGLEQTNSERRVASVLSRSFETVFYARADFLSNDDAYGGMDGRGASTLRIPFSLLLGGLRNLEPDVSSKLFTIRNEVFLGARRFRPPNGLGAVISEKCYIVILGGSGNRDLGRYFRLAVTVRLDGEQVWKWSARLGEFGEESPNKPSMFYAAPVADSYLVITNNLTDLGIVMRALAGIGRSGAVGPGIPDWTMLSSHEIWGFRRIRRTGVVDEEAAGLSFVSPDVETLSFFVDFAKKESVIRILSANAGGRTEPGLARPGQLPPFKRSSEGVWEAEIPFSEKSNENDPLLLVLGSFGFGLYV